MIRVAIVGLCGIPRLGIEHALSQGKTIQVVAVMTDVDEMRLSSITSDIVLLDCSGYREVVIPVMIRALVEIAPVLAVSVSEDSSDSMSASHLIRAGAHGVAGRHIAADELFTAVWSVARGALYLSGSIAHQLETVLPKRSTERRPRLAPREMEVLQLIGAGLTHAQVARKIGLSSGTVDTYVKRIRAKIGAGNKAELVRRAIERGYISAADQSGHLAAIRPDLPMKEPIGIPNRLSA